MDLFIYVVYLYFGVQYNPPENKSGITNNDQICATTIKNTSNPGAVLTLPELPKKQNDKLLMILLFFVVDLATSPQN